MQTSNFDRNSIRAKRGSPDAVEYFDGKDVHGAENV
jgi:hypothetical protein